MNIKLAFATVLTSLRKLEGKVEVRNIRKTHLNLKDGEEAMHTEYGIPLSAFAGIEGTQAEIDSVLKGISVDLTKKVNGILAEAKEKLKAFDGLEDCLAESVTVSIEAPSVKSAIIAGFQNTAIDDWHEREGRELPVASTGPVSSLDIEF